MAEATVPLPAELRTTLKDIADLLKVIRDDQQKMRVDLGRIDGRVSQLPTVWGLVGLFIALLALSLAGQAGMLLIAGRLLGGAAG